VKPSPVYERCQMLVTAFFDGEKCCVYGEVIMQCEAVDKVRTD
jgi:hypothetical protein